MGGRRRRSEGEKILDDLLEMLFSFAKSLSWYIGTVIAIVSYFVFHYLFIEYSNQTLTGAQSFLRLLYLTLQYLLPGIFGLGAFFLLYYSFRNKELFRNTTEGNVIDNVSKMNWKDFEKLIGEYFRSQGYSVTQAGGAHADGGVDVELRKDGELHLVQCKHYRSWKVPVETVRDLYGVMTSRGAVGGYVVTSGRFTKPAKEFAEGRAITLIDGNMLGNILKKQDSQIPEQQTEDEAEVPQCPKCGSSMIRRTAHRGSHSGSDFWGCSKYPKCKQIIEIP